MDQRPPHSDDVEVALGKAKELVSWLDDKLQGVGLKGDHRHRIPAQLFDLALEHHAGIVELLASRLYAAGFALVRCEFECFVRASWLHYCATDDELQAFVDHDSLPLHMAAWIEALEQKPEFEGGFLSYVKEAGWTAMNGYTHGGIHQVSRRMQDDHIETNFEDDALLEVIRFSGAMALLALGRIAALADLPDLWAEAEAKMGEV